MKIDTLRSKVVYKNPWISVREDRVVKPGGHSGVFGVVTIGDGSSVVPIGDDGQVFLAKEYKYGLGAESVEVFSGAIEDGETPLDAAHRELEEELGVTATKWTDLGFIDPFTTVVKSRNHIFLAQGLIKAEPHPDLGEVLEVFSVPLADAMNMVQSGEISHGASCVAILKAYLHFQKPVAEPLITDPKGDDSAGDH